MAEEVMKLFKSTFVAALAITTISAVASPGQAAPLPTNVAAMKAALDTPAVQVRYGRWYGGGWGHRGWGGGYRGWGHRGGWGYRGGLGLGAAGAIVGGAIASSAYYGGAYPYYDGGYGYGGGYGGGYASDYCPPQGYGGYYSGYRRHYYGW
jgi:hypothetical protein